MSVVNKMLKDLEARKAQPNSMNADYLPSPTPSFKLWKIVIVSIIIVAIFVIVFTDTLTGLSRLFTSEQPTPLRKDRPKISKKMLASKKVDAIKDLLHQVQNEEVATRTSQAIPPKKINSPVIQPKITQRAVPKKVVGNTAAKSKDDKEDNKKPEPQSSFAMVSSSKESQTVSLKEKISESLANNDIKQASLLLNTLINDEPNNLEAIKKLASLYFAQGNYQQTKLLLLTSIERFPEQGDLRLMLARLYVLEKTTDDALQILMDFQPSQDIRVEYLTYRAALAQQLNRNTLAKVDYQALTLAEPNNAKWWLGLGIVSDKMGNLNDALSAYQKAFSIGTLDVSVEDFVSTRISVLTEDQ